MKKKIVFSVLTFLLIIPCLSLLFACGKKDYKITLQANNEVYYADLLSSQNANCKVSDFYNSYSYLTGFDVYDYSNMKVLFNGKENSEYFTNTYTKNTTQQILGNSVQLGTFNFSNIKEDINITITGIKERKVNFAFIYNLDERLGYLKHDYTIEEQTTIKQNLETFGKNYKIKLSQTDYEYFVNEANEKIANGETDFMDIRDYTDDKGYTNASWLFNDNIENIMYVDNYGNEIYSPYLFTYNAKEFFKQNSYTVYQYIKDGNYFSSNEKLDNVEKGTKEYVYKLYSYNSQSANLKMLSTKGYNYYTDLIIGNYTYNHNYRGETSSSIIGYGHGSLNSNEYKCIDDGDEENYANQINYSMRLYPENLIYVDLLNMKINTITASIENTTAYIDNGNGSYSTSCEVGKANVSKRINIINLCQDVGVSGIDVSNAKVLVNGKELTGLYGSYKYVAPNVNEGIEEHFECVINLGVLPIHFYTEQELKDENVFKNNYYSITFENIDFSNAKGVTKVKISSQANKDQGYIDISASTDDDASIFALHKWFEDDVLYGYITQQSYTTGNLIKIGAYFSSPVLLNMNSSQKLIVKHDGVTVKQINVIESAKKVINGTMQGDYETEYNRVSWQEDGYKIIVEFYTSSEEPITSQYVSSILIQTQIDTQVNEYEFCCDVI